MSLFPQFRGVWLLRRCVVELRGIRKALDRQADAAELAAGMSSSHATAFRSFSRTKSPLSDREVKDLTEVSYVDPKELGGMLGKEEELRVLLGRDPSPEETLRAWMGEIE